MMWSPHLLWDILLCALLWSRLSCAMASIGTMQLISHSDPRIHYHGRWDSSPATWWAGSGLKLNVYGLKSLTLTLGPLTTSPNVVIGYSVNYEPFQTLNVSSGANILPLPTSLASHKSTVIRINVEGWQNNRLHFQSLALNREATLLPYKPSPLKLQFIGDSLTAGQYDPNGIDDSWGFLAAETLKAEYQINAQPGICLTDQLCWGNARGISHQFFETEDTGYYSSPDHNYTTHWDFSRDGPQPTHVILAIGANDNAYNVSADSFTATQTAFVDRLRFLYPSAPFFILNPWGWPQPDGSVSLYYEGCYQAVIDKRKAVGDNNIFLIDATGWLSYEDVFSDNQHPTPQGHAKVAAKFVQALEDWGLKPEKTWATKI